MNLPVVSIVGRPNVGKSTLFNRIIRRREAIVDDAPGITRDRKSAEADWEGVRFSLVDTGGYIPQGRNVIESGVTHQVRLAINESDVIVFLTDCTTGITDTDDVVAKLLRRCGKGVVLAVNKVDEEKRIPDVAEFVKLGLGEPVAVSALSGRNTGDLLSGVIAKLKLLFPLKQKLFVSADIETEARPVQLAVVGKPNAGKSTFINTILGEERLLVTEIPGTTRDAVDVYFRYKHRDFVIIDTAGMRKRSRVKDNVEYYSYLRTHRVVERCDVACVFLDAGEELAQQDMRVIREVVDARKGVVVVVNKWDLLKGNREKQEEWKENLNAKLQGWPFVPVVFVSCKTKLRVRKVLDFALDISREREKRIDSPELNRFIEELNRQYQPPAVRGKRVRILYGTQTGVRPPQIVVFSNYPMYLKESYKRFIENRFREQFGFEGVPISLLFRQK